MLKFPEKTQIIFETLKNNGFECYAVGGCVRDMLMGRTPADFDFTTDATPKEIAGCFEGYKTIDTGIEFGTVAVVVDDDVYEITTFRLDGDYKDNRHPDNVTFSKDIEDDLCRRDFTVNSIAASSDGEIIDPWGGIIDIERKVIRTTGKAEKRFLEDALRILRALRFSSKLNFSIEQSTKAAIHSCKDNLSSVHPQRIKKELEGLILSNVRSDFLFEFTDVLSVIIPDIEPVINLKQNNPHHIYSVWKHTLVALENTPEDLEIRLAVLFHDFGKAQAHTTDSEGIDHFKGHQAISASIAQRELSRFGFSSKLVNNVVTLIKYHDERFRNGDADIKKVLRITDTELFFKLMDIQMADTLAQSEYKREDKINFINNVKKRAQEIVDKGECYKISQLSVNGDDVLSCGYKGREVGEVLNMLLNAVISQKCDNDREKLLYALKNKILI